MNSIFGEYGDAYVSEILASRLEDISKKWDEIKETPEYIGELKFLLSHYGLRPTKITEARNLGLLNDGQGAKIILKREDQINTAYGNLTTSLGMILFAKMIGETHILSETMAGSNGIAVASACATLGLKCTIFNGDGDANKSNLFSMRMLGAKIVGVEHNDAIALNTTSETLRFWHDNIEQYFYIPYSPASPDPYPRIFHDILKIIGNEAREQTLNEYKKLPDVIISPLSQGSNIISLYSSFCDNPDLEFVVVEPKSEDNIPEEESFDGILKHTKPGIACGLKTKYIQDEHYMAIRYKTEINNLVYPIISPEVANLYDQGKILTSSITYTQALEACVLLARNEGIICSLLTGYSLACALEKAVDMHKSKTIFLTVNGVRESGELALSNYIKGRL